jgi:hypothetical protein
MTMFIEKPRPEVGKQLTCTARPGPHNELHVQRLISITDAPATAPVVISDLSVQPETVNKQPVTAPALTIEQLAEKILSLKAQWKDKFASDMLEFKWTVGREISVARRQQEPETFRELEKRTGISYSDLARCVQFYGKFPNRDYELKAWSEIRAELPAGKEPVTESPSALVVDQKHPWVCPECDAKFEGVHTPDGKHRLRECKAD